MNQPPSPQDPGIDPKDVSFLWGMAPVPLADTPANFLALGGCGSGKTLTLRLLLRSAVALIGRGLDHRALVYDHNGSWESWLRGMDPRCPVDVIRPSDPRGSAWDIAADITSPSSAHKLAACLVPNDMSAQPFFADAARTVMTAVLLGLINTVPEKWGLADVLLVTQDRQRLLSFLAQTPEGTAASRSFGGDDHVLTSVLATIANRLHHIEAVAECWKSATPKLSLKRWLQGESVLVIRDSHEPHLPESPIIQAMLACASEFIFTEKQSKHRRSWICLDDFCWAGRLDTLAKLMVQGGQQGACVALSASGVEEVRRRYGMETAEEMLVACSHMTALRTSDPETAAWAEQHLGPPLLASDLMSLPPPGPVHGFSAFCRTPKAGTNLARKSWGWILASL